MEQERNNMSRQQPTPPHSRQKPKSHKRDHECDEDNVGCLSILKKLSCSLQCGGTSCSIKETEHTSGSSGSTTPVASEASSFGTIDVEQEQPKPIPAPKVRKRSSRKKSDVVNALESTEPPVVKRARRPSKKKSTTETLDLPS